MAGLLMIRVMLVVMILAASESAPAGRGRNRRREFNEVGANFQGDIILPDEDTEGGSKFSLMPSESKKWPNNELYFDIDNDMPSNVEDDILKAIDKLNAAFDGCIDFLRNDGAHSYVRVMSTSGCSATIGYTTNPKMNLGSNCPVGTIMHEFLHTLGVWHEQSRDDRDDYIYVDFDEIREGKEHNFQKTGEQGYEVTHYDYDSIMHYPEWAFQRGDKPTIIPLDENAEIGVRGDLSACDIEKVKVHYGCKSKAIICPLVGTTDPTTTDETTTTTPSWSTSANPSGSSSMSTPMETSTPVGTSSPTSWSTQVETSVPTSWSTSSGTSWPTSLATSIGTSWPTSWSTSIGTSWPTSWSTSIGTSWPTSWSTSIGTWWTWSTHDC